MGSRLPKAGSDSRATELLKERSRRRPSFAEPSLAAVRIEPARLDYSSRAVSWTSLLLDAYSARGACDAYTRAPTPDIRLVVGLRGACELFARQATRWLRIPARSGSVGVNDCSLPMEVRWNVPESTAPFDFAAVYLPRTFVEEAAEQFRLPGQRLQTNILSSLTLNDRAIAGVLASLATAARHRFDDLYAERAARWLAVHLIHAHGRPFDPSEDRRHGGSMDGARTKRVLEFIQAHLGGDLSITELARVAALSPFHFARAFARAVGTTPHRYISGARMQVAAQLLHESDLPIAKIGSSCGYPLATTFSTAFLKRFGVTPSRFRKDARV
jgi:AraC family transcriptional regulator